MNPYVKNQVVSASPGQLVVMLYDGLLRYLDSAIEGFNEKDSIKRIEVIHDNLVRAQKILDELNVSLDTERGGALAYQLSDLYTYYLASLAQANILKDQARIEVVRSMIQELREGWIAVVRKQELLIDGELATNAA